MYDKLMVVMHFSNVYMSEAEMITFCNIYFVISPIMKNRWEYIFFPTKFLFKIDLFKHFYIEIQTINEGNGISMIYFQSEVYQFISNIVNCKYIYMFISTLHLVTLKFKSNPLVELKGSRGQLFNTLNKFLKTKICLLEIMKKSFQCFLLKKSLLHIAFTIQQRVKI